MPLNSDVLIFKKNFQKHTTLPAIVFTFLSPLWAPEVGLSASMLPPTVQSDKYNLQVNLW